MPWPTLRKMRSNSSSLDLGRMGEEAALAHYRRSGYRLVARNWRCPLGELDLVLSRGRTLVFSEVKTRRSSALGAPHESVAWKKQRKLRVLAQAFLAELKVPRQEFQEVRFDVASVTPSRQGGATVYVFEQAF